MKNIDKKRRDLVLSFQRNEITEHIIYEKLSERIKDRHNSEILKEISAEELEHYKFWRKFTNEDVKPNRVKIWFYLFVSRFLGLTFAIKLMEQGELGAEIAYGEISDVIPGALSIAKEEDEHERELMAMIDEEHLRYIGSTCCVDIAGAKRCPWSS